MFDALIVQPIYNLLVFIYALIPGHDLGISIIIFTVLVRLLMWPLVKKQLHHARAMRELQPELKRIKEETKGSRQLYQLKMMELYKEREINPFAPIGNLIVQLPILLGLWFALNNLLNNPGTLFEVTYPFVRNLDWIQQLAADMGRFTETNTLLGLVELGRKAVETTGIYWPAMLIAAGSAAIQYLQSKQLTPASKDAKGLRQIMREATETGKPADQSDVTAATSRVMLLFLPGFIFFISLNLVAALPLYWLAGGIVAYLQQRRILNQDKIELVRTADTASKKTIIEGEVVTKSSPAKPSKNKKKSTSKKSKSKKRR